MKTVKELKVQIFADGADVKGMAEMAKEPWISGFTTNPTLMRKVGISDYEKFAKDVLDTVRGLPISFEVFADDFPEMERQAKKIASWGKNVFVKLPITNTKGESALELAHRLAQAGVQLNVTALMTLEQVAQTAAALKGGPKNYISVFAGRIADTGRDPVPHMTAALALMEQSPTSELIWASPRELLNVFQADAIGCHVITVTNDILGKLKLVGKDLKGYSLETVEMFYRDGKAAGFTL